MLVLGVTRGPEWPAGCPRDSNSCVPGEELSLHHTSMTLALCCALPFYHTQTPPHKPQIILDAADIVESLLTDANPKSRRRRRSSTGSRRRKATGQVTPQTTPAQPWRQLGATLRQIADKFGAGQNKSGQTLTSTDAIMSAVVTFLVWKIVKKTFL